MGKKLNSAFLLIITVLTAMALLVLAFVIFFIVKEALPVLETAGLSELLTGSRWMPVDYGTSGGMAFGLFNFIAGSVAVSFLAIVISSVVGLGAAMYLSCAAGERTRAFVYPVIDLLAGIPSVVYGFVGIVVMLPLFLKAGVHTGSCVLAAGILLSAMLLPFLVSSCSDTMLRAKECYMPSAEAMGISKWYAMATIVLPASWRNILFSMILAVGRAMGETMAVMMVIGNANLFPNILGKGETIASVIALEMGTAVVGSAHYHALYMAGLILMIIVFFINMGIMLLRKHLLNRGGAGNA
ncbi:MAG: phosphate ABC transporter permease subunit PstC [Clostridia bacterium]|nr:phosphate ABC transporter permease subunit PstC [Clostridia bacterium]